MDWEANLAAIIKCTDASLEQQFRQFEDVTAEFSTVDATPTSHYDPSNDNVAATYLRDTMASDYRHRQQHQKEQPTRTQSPSYTRVSSAFATPAPTTATSSFSEHFHRRHERKRDPDASVRRTRDNQQTHHRGGEYGPVEEEAQQVQDHEVDEPHYATTRPSPPSTGTRVYHKQQMYSSPTYDMAQMMEQVRLSLKLEVDARAAITERQLSALLQLCKATTEELDRLRVEVCANDRQLHTLDQVQSKIRQELTTQKDIGFHLQSMCGKDESWRMQTENQLLELRQMVAALREQGNSTQAVTQEKLSRSELLVQFNAAMEPIKAQLQANLQHQAQQIAEITRTTSSSSLLLDGLTQKVNRGVMEELNELRSDLNALKHHVAKMDIFQDGGRGEGLRGRSPQLSKEETDAKAKEEQQQQEKKLADLREGLQKELLVLVKEYVDAQTKPIQQAAAENGSRFVAKHEFENLRNALEDGCRSRCTTTTMQLDSQLKSVQEQLRGECNAAVRDSSSRFDSAMQQNSTVMKTALDGQVSSCHNKQVEFIKMIETEQKDRKQALDELHESLRKSRHQLEDQIHTLTQESRMKLAQRDSDFEKRLMGMEKQVENTAADLQRDNQATVASLKSAIEAQNGSHTVEWEQKLKRLEEIISSTNVSGGASSTSPSTPTPLTSLLPLSSTAKGKEIPVVPVLPGATTSSKTVVKVDSMLPPTTPITGSVVSGAPKFDDQSACPPPPQSAPINSAPQSRSSPAPRQNPLSSTISAPTQSVSPVSREDNSPSLSPLAKIFSRPTAAETVPAQVVQSASILLPASDQNESNAQPPTSVSSASTNGAPGSHVLCGLCRLPVRSDHKTEHEKSQCPKRMVECVSCKQQMQWASLEMHELGCSEAQSNKSETIGTAISLTTVKPQPEVASTADLGSLKKCRHCSADVPSLDLLEHEINCDKVLKQCPHCLRRQKMSELQDHIENCDCRLVSCPNKCGGKFLQRGIPNHLATRCPKKPATASFVVAPTTPATPRPEINKPAAPPPSATQLSSTSTPTGKVECKFCDDEIDACKIDDHEENCDWKPKRCQHCNMVVISRDLLRHETSCKTNVKSCPHCNENMPPSALTTHASRCSKRPIKCIRCCQLFPADAIVAHSTNCKFVPAINTTGSSPQQQIQTSVGSQQMVSRAPIKIPPPPPFPPPSTATAPVPVPQLISRRATAEPVKRPASAPAQETESDRLARRNLALSQLTNPGTPAAGGRILQQDRDSGVRASAPSFQSRSIIQPGRHDHVEDEEDEEDGDEDYDEDDDQLTLAQVVREWSVENVCLWLHEDVGVPDVVLRFQQKQCNGEMLLELTESDLINDFGVRDRVQRERILSAVEAINTSNAFSDEDEEGEEEGDDDDLEESENYDAHESGSPSPPMRHSIGGAATITHPRDILRRKSQPSPEKLLGGELPSSNDMLRRISNALENPKR